MKEEFLHGFLGVSAAPEEVEGLEDPVLAEDLARFRHHLDVLQLVVDPGTFSYATYWLNLLFSSK